LKLTDQIRIFNSHRPSHPHLQGCGPQSPQFFTRVISITQLFSRVLPFLSSWLTTTSRHPTPI